MAPAYTLDHDSDSPAAASELAESLWMYTQDLDAGAVLVEVLLAGMLPSHFAGAWNVLVALCIPHAAN
jgi:hypothetical protein